MFEVKQIKNQPIDSNCYVIYDKAFGNGCIIVDPGSEDNSHLYGLLNSEGLNPQYIILTHEHFDHCWGVNDLREKYPNVKIACSILCSDAIQHKKMNYSVFYRQPGFELAAADIILETINWEMNWNNNINRFVPAQGHSAAGIIIFIDKYLFTGDTLIKDVKTVTKLKTASKEKLVETITLLEKEKGNNFIVCPGHGEMFNLDGYDMNHSFCYHCNQVST